MGKVPGWVCLHLHRKLGLCSSVYVFDVNMVGKKQDMGPTWKSPQKETDLDDPTPLMDQAYWGCTHREAKVFHQAVSAVPNRVVQKGNDDQGG